MELSVNTPLGSIPSTPQRKKEKRKKKRNIWVKQWAKTEKVWMFAVLLPASSQLKEIAISHIFSLLSKTGCVPWFHRKRALPGSAQPVTQWNLSPRDTHPPKHLFCFIWSKLTVQYISVPALSLAIPFIISVNGPRCHTMLQPLLNKPPSLLKNGKDHPVHMAIQEGLHKGTSFIVTAPAGLGL